MSPRAVAGGLSGVPQAIRWRALIVVSGLLVALVAPAAYSRTSPSSDPGCATGPLAVAYHADGSAQFVPRRPVSCAVTTGFAGAETQIKAAPNGTLIEEPAMIHPLKDVEP